MKALLSVAVLLALASGVWAQRVFPIVELTDADVGLIDVHDGSVDDWLAVIGEPTLTALDRYGPYDPSSMDLRIWLAWHDATTGFSWPCNDLTTYISIALGPEAKTKR